METFINDVISEFKQYYDLLVTWMPRVIIGIVVLIVFILIANGLQRVILRYLMKRTEELLIAQFVVRAMYILMIAIGIVAALHAGGMNDAATKLMAGAGVTAIILGFAFKDIGENFLAGILLAFKRPFRINDLVEIENILGRISGLNLRETIIKTLDGKDVFIPNSMIVKNPITNYTLDGHFRDSFTVGLDYGDDIDKAIQLTIATIQSLNDGLGTGRDPLVIIKDLGTSSLNLEVNYWLVTDKPEYNIPGLRTIVVKEVLEALMKNGFYLPSDILEVKNYHDESFRSDWINKERSD